MIGGGIIALWNQIKNVWGWLSGFLICSVEVNGKGKSAVSYYVYKKFKPCNLSSWYCNSRVAYVKPVERVECIGCYKTGGSKGSFFRNGNKFVFYKEDDYICNVYFLRGSFKMDDFLIEALDFYNNFKHNLANENRYEFTRVMGDSSMASMSAPSRKKQSSSGTNDLSISGVPASYGSYEIDLDAVSYLKYSREDLRSYEFSDKDVGLESLSLDSDCEDLIDKLKFWKDNKKWFKDRGLNWKTGVCLYGLPGTGKSSFVRGIAQSLNFPIFCFDLATLSNFDFPSKWKDTVAISGPAIALIEDIDGVFAGRENITQNKTLSFDTLLNVIDGVEQTDGVLLFITTNCLDKVDPALLRPGRVDSLLEMKPLTKDGRVKIANRILSDYPDKIEALVNSSEGDTGAQFQEKCVDLGGKLFWEKMGLTK